MGVPGALCPSCTASVVLSAMGGAFSAGDFGRHCHVSSILFARRSHHLTADIAPKELMSGDYSPVAPRSNSACVGLAV